MWAMGDICIMQPSVSKSPQLRKQVSQTLYSTIFLAYASRSQFCPNCMLSDHTQEECALTSCSRQGTGKGLGERGTMEKFPELVRKSPKQQRKWKTGQVLPGMMAGVHALPTANFNIYALSVLETFGGQCSELAIKNGTAKDLKASCRRRMGKGTSIVE